MSTIITTIDVSEGFENYSQRNNVIVPQDACGPTNFIQGLEYSGWQWDWSIYPELKQPEDKLMKFCRTNKAVLDYYKKHYYNLYKNWIDESTRLGKEQRLQPWEVRCPKSYPPNEIHDVMSYACNLFLGYTPAQIEKVGRPVTQFMQGGFSEARLLTELKDKHLPVVTSVDPFKRGSGHYITIVGCTIGEDGVIDYIIDNTYGRFNFKEERYEAVSGNNEHISRAKLLEIVKPVMHFFTAGAAACC